MGTGICSSAKSAADNEKIGERSADYHVVGINDNNVEAEYQFGKQIAKRVIEAKNKVTGVINVIYQVRKRETPCGDGTAIGERLVTLREFEHPNVCMLLETFQAESVVYLVYQHCKSMLLEDWVTKSKDRSEVIISKIVRQLLRCVSAASCEGLVHGCIVPKNIFVNSSSFQVVVSDMGLHDWLKHHVLCMADPAGVCYMAPELIEPWLKIYYAKANNKDGGEGAKVALKNKDAQKPAVSSDMWSIGCILFLLLTGKPVFEFPKNTSTFTMANEVVGCSRWEKKMNPLNKASELARKTTEAMLQKQLVDRIKVEDAMTLPFFKDVSRLSALPMAREVLMNFVTLNKETHFKKFMMTFISTRLPSSRVKMLEQVFNAADDNGNGFLEISELEIYIDKYPDTIDSEMKEHLVQTFKEIDDNGNDIISLREFIAASIDCTDVFSDHKVLMEAFRIMDKDKSGMLSHVELARVVREVEDRQPIDVVEALIKNIQSEVADPMTFEMFAQHVRDEGLRAEEAGCCGCVSVAPQNEKVQIEAEGATEPASPKTPKTPKTPKQK